MYGNQKFHGNDVLHNQKKTTKNAEKGKYAIGGSDITGLRRRPHRKRRVACAPPFALFPFPLHLASPLPYPGFEHPRHSLSGYFPPGTGTVIVTAHKRLHRSTGSKLVGHRKQSELSGWPTGKHFSARLLHPRWCRLLRHGETNRAYLVRKRLLIHRALRRLATWGRGPRQLP